MINKIIDFFKKPSIRLMLPIVGIVLVIISATLLLWHGHANSNQSIPATTATVYFSGEYRIGDGEWKEIVKGEHISSTKGDVVLRGNFHMLAPNGEYVGVYREDLPIAFYLDHISLTFYEVGSSPFMLDMENPIYGRSVCGVNWEAYCLTSKSDDLIEILIHNPHTYGNENAIDEMLSKVMLLPYKYISESAVADKAPLPLPTVLSLTKTSCNCVSTTISPASSYVPPTSNLEPTLRCPLFC